MQEKDKNEKVTSTRNRNKPNSVHLIIFGVSLGQNVHV